MTLEKRKHPLTGELVYEHEAIAADAPPSSSSLGGQVDAVQCLRVCADRVEIQASWIHSSGHAQLTVDGELEVLALHDGAWPFSASATIARRFGAELAAEVAALLASPSAFPRPARKGPEPMSASEVAAFFALGAPLEATWIPDDELRRAVVEGRVLQAISSSSMGTAETYWAAVDHEAQLDALRGSAIALPPGCEARSTAFEERLDDRDVEGVLWDPFRREQLRTVAAALVDSHRPLAIRACAHVLADLEERWCDAPTRTARAPFIVALRADSLDQEALRALTLGAPRSVRHLVRGLRSRFSSPDLVAAIDAVSESATRFDEPLSWQHAQRFALLRTAVRLATATVTTTATSPVAMLDADEEKAVLPALRALADRLAEADQENPGGVHGAPAFDVVAVERDEAGLTVHAIVDNMIWHMAQSGSDWFDHNVYAVTSRFGHGALEVPQEVIEKRGRWNVAEREEPAYDRAAKRRAAANEWVSLLGYSS